MALVSGLWSDTSRADLRRRTDSARLVARFFRRLTSVSTICIPPASARISAWQHPRRDILSSGDRWHSDICLETSKNDWAFATVPLGPGGVPHLQSAHDAAIPAVQSVVADSAGDHCASRLGQSASPRSLRFHCDPGLAFNYFARAIVIVFRSLLSVWPYALFACGRRSHSAIRFAAPVSKHAQDMTPLIAATWLTAKRLRAHGLILALCLWSVYMWNMSTPGLLDRAGNLKGTDFLHFYTLGSLALNHRGNDLYNLETQSQLAGRRVPAAAGICYLPLYPPQVSLFFAPFARLSYACALIFWLTLSSLIYGLCCYALWRACPNLRQQRMIVVILALAFPAFWHLIAWGQTSALALACFTAAFFALRERREFFAGLALGCLIFKPQLALASALVFVVTVNWKVIAGALFSAAVQLTAARLYYGPGPLRDWIHTLLNVPSLLPLLEPRLYQTHSLRTFWTMLIPWPTASLALYLTTALLVSALTVACWRSRLSLPLRYSAL